MHRVTLTIIAWCDNPSPASVGHPDTPQYRIRHEFIPLRTSERRHTTSRPRPEIILNHCIFLVLPILFQREVPPHIFCIVLSKIRTIPSYHRSRTSCSTTRSLLPHRNPLRNDSFPYVKKRY
jgi:hypothetical protein